MNHIRVRRRHVKNQLHFSFILLLACSACAIMTESQGRNVLRRQIVGLAQNLAGIPYVYGGSDIDGFDCSGLVFYVYDCFGIRLPRSAREQARIKSAIKLKSAAPGDILVFKLKKIWHSAIYMGKNCFVHAPNAEGWVRFETLNEYWRSHLHTVVAVLPSGR
jgi:cell wall-associated NlpC family hydrolase